MRYFIVVFLFLFSHIAEANSATNIVLVLIDQKTEQKLGIFPYQRDVFAKGIEKLSQMNAKEVLLKFFLDAHKQKSLDKQLVNAFKTIPVTLQTRIDNTEKMPNPLLAEYELDSEFLTVHSNLQGKSGWLPIPEFSQHAKVVGFIDSISPVLFVETYKGKAVGTLYFYALESIFGVKFRVENHQLFFGNNKVPLNSKNEYEYDWLSSQKVDHISYIDLIEDKVDANKIAGKYVIFGYDGAKIHQVPTPAGMMNAHVAFYQSLLSLISSFKKKGLIIE